MGQLLIASRERCGIMIIVIEGELDIQSGKSLMEELYRLINENSDKDVIMNITGMDFIDSHGLSLLIKLRKLVEERGNNFALCSPQSYVKRILKLAGFYTYFSIFEFEEDALNALAGTSCAG